MAYLNKRPVVSVACMTFNHAPYIRDALDGFVMQKTTFPFEIVIHDDASTDGTSDIIREYQKKYPHLIRAYIQKENQYQKGKKPFRHMTLPKLRTTKYIALCEGDDYWTDPRKLQKQFDLLRRYPECTFCFHPAEIMNDSIGTGIIHKAMNFSGLCDTGDIFYLTEALFSPTASLFFKKEAICNLPKFMSETPVGDIFLKLMLVHKGEVAYINSPMSVRRLEVSGSWTDIRKTNIRKKINDDIGIINYLDIFNKYSKYRFNRNILQQKVKIKMKLIRHQNISQKISFLYDDDIQEFLTASKKSYKFFFYFYYLLNFFSFPFFLLNFLKKYKMTNYVIQIICQNKSSKIGFMSR